MFDEHERDPLQKPNRSSRRKRRLTPEETLLRDAARLPQLRPSLRGEVLRAAVKANHRSWSRYGIQTAVASLLFITFGLLLVGYYLLLWQRDTAAGSIAAQQAAGFFGEAANNLAGRHPEAATDPLGAATGKPDDWALVDAYGQRKDRNRKVLKGTFWRD